MLVKDRYAHKKWPGKEVSNIYRIKVVRCPTIPSSPEVGILLVMYNVVGDVFQRLVM